jgi:hypothetical protein
MKIRGIHNERNIISVRPSKTNINEKAVAKPEKLKNKLTDKQLTRVERTTNPALDLVRTRRKCLYIGQLLSLTRGNGFVGPSKMLVLANFR